MSIPSDTPNLIVDALALSESQNKFYLAHPDFRPIKCESDAPYYNGDKCIPCSAPTEYFDVKTLTCAACKAGEIYSKKSKKCKTINPLLLLDFDAPNLIIPYGMTIE